MPARAYLARTMFARLLACLALVTGLAAVGAPVQAKMLSAASEQIESSTPDVGPGRSAECSPVEQRNVKATTQSQARCRARKPVVIYIPTVQFGPDRAYE